MDSALLQKLTTGAGSTGQFIGGLIVAMLYRSARRDWKYFYLSASLSRTMGTDILGLLSCSDCRLLLKLRCLFRGLSSCLAN